MFGRDGPRKSDNSKYYDILGISKNATEDEIKKPCRKVAMKNHSDKSGDPEKVSSLPRSKQESRARLKVVSKNKGMTKPKELEEKERRRTVPIEAKKSIVQPCLTPSRNLSLERV
ncbi:hypothetical protein VNO80_01998 [Phaseolus coccineus]|uniref:J domain-containing protein n=1 Tax=Phaseolus coccineus TaxID=3886 RepID=A0AAN9RTD0_PHACN